MTATASTTNLVKEIVEALRSFTDVNGKSIGEICDDRVYVTQAPDDASGTYVVLRPNFEQDWEVGGICENLKIEADVYGRPRAKEQEVELVAELLVKAFRALNISSADDGLVYFTDAKRIAEPPQTDPEDRELVKRSLEANGFAWPTYLTDE